MKKAGNALMALVGGREVHPINVRVGGFYRAPTPRASCARSSTRSSARARRRSRPSAGRPTLPFPDVERAPELRRAVASPGRYPIDRGRIVSDRRPRHRPGRVRRAHRRGARRALQRAARPHPRARHLPDRPARALRALAPQTLSAARARGGARGGLGPVCRNPFQSIVVRAVELVQACDEALAIIERYEEPDAPAVEVTPRARGRPRRHRGAARAALPPLRDRRATARSSTPRIVPPTSQNQLAIEEDLRAVVERGPRPPRRAALAALRAGDPQPRSLHLLRDPLPRR